MATWSSGTSSLRDECIRQLQKQRHTMRYGYCPERYVEQSFSAEAIRMENANRSAEIAELAKELRFNFDQNLLLLLD